MLRHLAVVLLLAAQQVVDLLQPPLHAGQPRIQPRQFGRAIHRALRPRR